ncbi:MAG: hypothetical protein ABIN74_02950, partial [Ferruginibacter sp.]
MSAKKLFFHYLLPTTCCLLLIAACKFRQKADLISHHAKIYTVDDKFSIAEAMVIRDGKIIAIGTNDDILKQYESDSIRDAGG